MRFIPGTSPQVEEAYVAGFGDNSTSDTTHDVYSSYRPDVFIVGYRTCEEAQVRSKVDDLKAVRGLFESVTVVDAVRIKPEKNGLVQGDGPSGTCYR
jgi:hypothetical protein